MHAWTFEAIGTGWQVDTADPLPEDVRRRVRAEVERFDRTWSRFRDDSLVAEMARTAGTWTLPPEADAMLALYTELDEVTGGAVNPLVGGALADLGYDAQYSLTPAEHPAVVPAWSSVTWSTTARGTELTTTEPVVLDVGAMGKGLLVDHVSALVGAHAGHGTIDAGGDLLHGGGEPLRVGLEHPHDATRAIGVAEIGAGDALCGSATNRRRWGPGLHHVLDGRTGRPTDDVIATWVVVAGSCARADALATAHFFSDADTLMARFDHEFVRVHADGRVLRSHGFPGEVFT